MMFRWIACAEQGHNQLGAECMWCVRWLASCDEWNARARRNCVERAHAVESREIIKWMHNTWAKTFLLEHTFILGTNAALQMTEKTETNENERQAVPAGSIDCLRSCATYENGYYILDALCVLYAFTYRMGSLFVLFSSFLLFRSCNFHNFLWGILYSSRISSCSRSGHSSPSLFLHMHVMHSVSFIANRSQSPTVTSLYFTLSSHICPFIQCESCWHFSWIRLIY